MFTQMNSKLYLVLLSVVKTPCPSSILHEMSPHENPQVEKLVHKHLLGLLTAMTKESQAHNHKINVSFLSKICGGATG